MLASCPSLRCSYRKRPVSCREAQRLVTQLWSPRFVAIQWLCSQFFVEIELLATVAWKWGCQPFSCPCSQNVTHCRKELCSTCLFKTSIPAVHFWNSKHPLPTRSRFLRATSSALWLHHAHPFVAATEKNLCHAEKQKVWSRSCGLQDLLRPMQWLCPRLGLQDNYRILIVLSVVTCDCCKPMNNCRNWAFSHSGLEAGLPAFQLPMCSKCDTLPKGNLWDMLVGFRNPFPLFLAETFNSRRDQRLSVRVKYWVGSHNPSRTLSGSMFELWISDGFE